jgi:hypothetical protein
MKKVLHTFSLLFISLCMFSVSSFAQDVPGGSGDGSGDGSGTPDGGSTGSTVAQPLGVHFTRNNGDGTCGGMAQIRLFYATAPTTAPVLTQIYYNDAPLYSNFTAVTGNISNYATTGYVSFCLSTSNIPPAIKLTLTYTASATQTGASISGTD